MKNPRMTPNTWIEAVKIWRNGRKGLSIPAKGTVEHAKILKIKADLEKPTKGKKV